MATISPMMLIQSVLMTMILMVQPGSSLKLEFTSDEMEWRENEECRSITEMICSNNDFTILCEAIEEGAFDGNDGTDTWTLFAPTDDAFRNLSAEEMAEISASVENTKYLLLNHAIKDLEVASKDLQCTKKLQMMNNKKTRTVCRDNKVYQKGAGNSRSMLPEIVAGDFKACNGIVHVVNEVILPNKYPPNKPAQKSISMNTMYYIASTTPLGDSNVKSETTLFIPAWDGLDTAPNDVVCFVGSAGNLDADIRSVYGGGGTDCSAGNGCGVHVHSGTDCADTETQGGHWYNKEVLSTDPWAIIGYKQTDQDGYGQYASCVRTGFDVTSDPNMLVGHVFIIHAEDGSRISCGSITEAPEDFQPITFTADTVPIPGTEDDGATGSVSVMANVQEVVTDGVCYMGYATGLEPDVESFLLGTGSEQCDVTNGCGAHIHAGTGCENADAQGGHYYDDIEIAEDPWKLESYYTTDSSGVAALIGCTISGDGAINYDSRPFVVHRTDGSRLLCGLLG